MRYPFAWAAGLLLATACQRHDDPITQQQQSTQKQEELATDAAMVQTPREKVISELVKDIREVHHKATFWALVDPSQFQPPYTQCGGSGKEQRVVRVYSTLGAYRADLKRRADSLRQTGPLDLSDTLYTPQDEANIKKNAQRFLRNREMHPEYRH